MTPNTHSASIEYATKADLDQLAKDLHAELRDFRMEFHASLREIRAEIHTLHRTIITAMIAMTAIFGTLITVLKLFG